MVSLNQISLGLVNDTKSYANHLKNNEALDYLKLDLNSIIQVDFPDNQYVKEQTNKKQIILHHTVSGQGVDGDISYWRQTIERIGTAIIIGWDGKIYQCFSSKYWAYHIGTKQANNKVLEMGSIGVEIDSWGGLVESNGKWYPAKWDDREKKYIPNTTIKAIENVQIYKEPFRGFYGYEKYTNAQIDALRKLLIFWGEKYNIPLTYNSDMWDVSSNALNGIPGVWTHISYRNDKSDCHPQLELIQMLKSL